MWTSDLSTFWPSIHRCWRLASAPKPDCAKASESPYCTCKVISKVSTSPPTIVGIPNCAATIPFGISKPQSWLNIGELMQRPYAEALREQDSCISSLCTIRVSCGCRGSRIGCPGSTVGKIFGVRGGRWHPCVDILLHDSCQSLPPLPLPLPALGSIGDGAVAINDMMEDLATFEMSRHHIRSWIDSGVDVTFQDGVRPLGWDTLEVRCLHLCPFIYWGGAAREGGSG